jgi:capsular polysaccharide transport system ATP-binding protein
MTDLLGGHAELDADLGDLPHSLRTLVGFGVSYALPFDVYVANGATMPGEPEHRLLLAPWVERRLKESGLILVTGSPVAIRDVCDVAGVWHEGKIRIFSDVKEAIAVYSARRPDHGRKADAS